MLSIDKILQATKLREPNGYRKTDERQKYYKCEVCGREYKRAKGKNPGMWAKRCCANKRKAGKDKR